jgi:hypothetical protein
MSDQTVVAPVEDNATATETPAKAGATLLTSVVEATPPLAEGATPVLPHAWMNGLTSEQKADASLIESLSKFPKGIPDMAKTYAELEKKSSSAAVVPNEESTDEEKARYRTARGVPGKPEDYKLEEVELPQGISVDVETQKAFLEVAHGLGLNDGEVNAINKWYMQKVGQEIADAIKVVDVTQEQALESFMKRHGTQAEANRTYMERGFSDLATPGLRALLDMSWVGNAPEILDMMVKHGKAIGNHEFVDGSRGESVDLNPIGKRTDEEISAVLYPAAKA